MKYKPLKVQQVFNFKLAFKILPQDKRMYSSQGKNSNEKRSNNDRNDQRKDQRSQSYDSSRGNKDSRGGDSRVNNYLYNTNCNRRQQ